MELIGRVRKECPGGAAVRASVFGVFGADGEVELAMSQI
jgi:hypothetical protein